MKNIIEVFHDNDQAYLIWLKENPGGYVLKYSGAPEAEYMELHKSGCQTINGEPLDTESRTGSYTKVCSRSKLALIAWADTKTGGFPRFCDSCM